MVGGAPARRPLERERRPNAARGSGRKLAVEPALLLEAVPVAWVVSEPDLDPELPMRRGRADHRGRKSRLMREEERPE